MRAPSTPSLTKDLERQLLNAVFLLFYESAISSWARPLIDVL